MEARDSEADCWLCWPWTYCHSSMLPAFYVYSILSHCWVQDNTNCSFTDLLSHKTIIRPHIVVNPIVEYPVLIAMCWLQDNIIFWFTDLLLHKILYHCSTDFTSNPPWRSVHMTSFIEILSKSLSHESDSHGCQVRCWKWMLHCCCCCFRMRQVL